MKLYEYQKKILEEIRNSDNPFEIISKIEPGLGKAIIVSQYIQELKTEKNESYELLVRMNNVLEACIRDFNNNYETILEECRVLVESSSNGCTNRGHAVEPPSDGCTNRGSTDAV